MDMDKLTGFFTQLFTELSSEDSIIILIFLLVSFLIGLLFGWWSGRKGKRKLKKALKQKESELISLQAEHKAIQEQLELKEADLTKAHLENEELKVSISKIEKEKAVMNNQLFESSTALEKLKSEHLASLSQIEALHNQVADRDFDSDLDNDVSQVNSFSAVDLSQVQSNYDNANIRLAAIEDKLSRLERENVSLKSEIRTIKQEDSTISFLDEDTTVIETDEEVELEEVADSYVDDTSVIMDPNERATLARQKLQSAFGQRIAVADATNKDDLKKINGIGPFIEQKLNEIGIYTYDQISQFDDELIDQITDAIQFFPGRIKRDDWVGQAKQLKS